MEKNFKTYDSKKFNKLVSAVEQETSYNNHSEALTKIADFFGYDEYYHMYKVYSEMDGLTIEDFNKRCEIKDRMFYIIQAEYGSEVVARLDKVL